MTPRILLIDDKRSILEILETALRGDGCETVCVESGAEAIETLGGELFDAILCDVRLPDISGIDVLRAAREKQPQTSVIMVTAYGSIENAIECMKIGADDYVTKPFNLDEIRAISRKAVEKTRLMRENTRLKEELGRRYNFGNIIGKSKEIQDVMHLVQRVAGSNASVLVSGDTGTGKELVARAVHANSQRANAPFIALNCAAIPENLLESELFGHQKGAFTGAVTTKRGLFEEADGGTLLLDEINELHQGLQAKLLRTLDEGTIRRVGDTKSINVDVRLVCSTNVNLLDAVGQGRFRIDLYHRVRVVEIHIPALRERRQDIPMIASFYLEKLAADLGRQRPEITAGAMTRLLAYEWPGNVRELINVMEQALLLCEGDALTEQYFDSILMRSRPAADEPQTLTLKDNMLRAERVAIVRALHAAGGSRKEASRLLDISERSLYYKLEEHHIQ